MIYSILFIYFLQRNTNNYDEEEIRTLECQSRRCVSRKTFYDIVEEMRAPDKLVEKEWRW